MTKTSLIFFVTVASTATMASATQSGRGSVDARTGPIVVEVVVQQQGGAPALNLTSADFEIRSGDRVLPVIRSVREGGSLTLGVVVDVTMSLDPLQPREIRQAWREFVDAKVKTTDRVQLSLLADRLYVASLVTGERKILGNAFDALDGLEPVHTLGPSPIWDAIVAQARALPTDGTSRAVIVVTDGEASGDVNSASDATNTAARTGVSVSFVEEAVQQTAKMHALPRGIGPTQMLRTIADGTGGLYCFDPLEGVSRNPFKCAGGIVDALRSAYAVTFEGTWDGQDHELSVSVREPGLVARARTSYVAPIGGR